MYVIDEMSGGCDDVLRECEAGSLTGPVFDRSAFCGRGR